MRLVSRLLLSVAILMVHIMLTVRITDGPTWRHSIATAPVVVAQRDMPAGVTIDRASLAVAQWPVGTIPAGAFTSIESVVGRVTRVAVYTGEGLVPGRLAPQRAGHGHDVKITPGKRAMSFRVNDGSVIAGLIQPNSRVDILVVIDRGGRGKVARIAIENLRVLALATGPDRSMDGRVTAASVATVEVTPDEAEKLALLTTQGSIQLLLLPGDPDRSRTSFTTPFPPNVVRNAIILRR